MVLEYCPEASSQQKMKPAKRQERAKALQANQNENRLRKAVQFNNLKLIRTLIANKTNPNARDEVILLFFSKAFFTPIYATPIMNQKRLLFESCWHRAQSKLS